MNSVISPSTLAGMIALQHSPAFVASPKCQSNVDVQATGKVTPIDTSLTTSINLSRPTRSAMWALHESQSSTRASRYNPQNPLGHILGRELAVSTDEWSQNHFWCPACARISCIEITEELVGTIKEVSRPFFPECGCDKANTD